MSIGDAIAAAAQLGAGNRTQWPLVTREVTGEKRGSGLDGSGRSGAQFIGLLSALLSTTRY